MSNNSDEILEDSENLSRPMFDLGDPAANAYFTELNNLIKSYDLPSYDATALNEVNNIGLALSDKNIEFSSAADALKLLNQQLESGMR